LTAFISPFREDRRLVRGLFPHGDFLGIYCNASLDVCEERDVKGLYNRARAGEVKEFTGISSPYEIPEKPELEVNTGQQSLESSVNAVVNLLQQRGILQPV
jgi:adenylylsulfate kinase